MNAFKRTHNCGELTKKEIGKEVTMTGWVARRRDHGGLIFVDLRDRYGITQVVFGAQYDVEAHQKAKELRSEYVIAIKGRVEQRPEGMVNPKLKTGEVEVVANQLQVLNTSKTLPFPIEDRGNINEELRLKYRYLDLRRPRMQRNFLLRHKTYQIIRNFLSKEGFIEVETPILIKGTPEGARDYLVPSRVNKGKFYALAQSPQIYKQILMISGYDKYFQIAKCFRDEDLRADRQPEFTQIDMEMSFVDENDVMEITERLLKEIFRKTLGVEINASFPKMTYRQALSKYGTDKPDTRFGLEIVDVTEIVKETDFEVFQKILASEGKVKGINAKGCAHYSRKQIDELRQFVQQFGVGGLVWMKSTDSGVKSPVSGFFSEGALNSLLTKMGTDSGDLLLFAAGDNDSVVESLSELRLKLGRELNLIDEKKYNLLWVIQPPLLEYDKEEARFVSTHHPFTLPVEEDLEKIGENPSGVRTRAYDLVLNGKEIAGGSIRIHHRQLQEKIFELLGISHQEAWEKFGFLLEALEYGAPPHGGIAFGFDRLTAILSGEESIREVIAFPKTNKAISLVDGAPSEVQIQQLKELGLHLRK